MEDIGVLRVWGFRGDFDRFFCGYGMGMGIEIQSSRQPCLYEQHCELVTQPIIIVHFHRLGRAVKIIVADHLCS